VDYVRAEPRPWTREEVEKLKRLYPNPNFSIKDLEKEFGRSFRAIQAKALRLGLTRNGFNPEYVRKNDDRPVEEKVLDILKASKLPVSAEEIEEKVGVSNVEEVVNALRGKGYDIKEIHAKKPLYVLVRFADWSQEQYFRILGKIRTPCLLTADWHVGSRHFSELALKEMIKDVEEYNIKDVLIAGDLLQGLGVHRVELLDLSIPNITEQVNYAAKLLKQFPKDVRFHIIIGNHEEKLKGKHAVGYDALQSLSEKLDNVIYYGSVAKLQLDTDFTLLMVHFSGSPSYAVSYKIQRFYEQLIERPDILVAGHFHQLMVLPKPPRQLLIYPGTLQRENRYFLSKGWVAQVGWIILETYTPIQQNIIIRTPEVY